MKPSPAHGRRLAVALLALGAPRSRVALTQHRAFDRHVTPGERLERLLVEVHNLGDESHNETPELVGTDGSEDRVADEVKRVKGAVICRQLAEALGGGDLVVAQVQPEGGNGQE